MVGETPYAEGFGDVGGPLWQDNGVPREPKTMRLSDADRAAVDRVCGSIGEVADMLFGERPFTGRLSMIWPRSLEQEPINVGDRDYHLLFPYGFVLRTSVR